MVKISYKGVTIEEQRQRTFFFSIALICLFVASLQVSRWYIYHYVPIERLSANLPDAAKVGNVPKAIEQCHELYKVWKDEGGDFHKIYQSHPELLYLPDRQYAEDPILRNGKTVSFLFPDNSTAQNTPESNNLAFYSRIYVRLNGEVFRGDYTKTHLSGFYLVAWKTGEVSAVPVDQVRIQLLPMNHSYSMLFPGMPEYDPNNYKLPEIELADGIADTPRERALETAISGQGGECSSCSLHKGS